MNKPRVVFMGTPEFAVAGLKALWNQGYPVVGVVTAPDKPAGRGRKVTPSAVKEFALSHNIPVLQPERLKDPEFLQQLSVWQADIQVVVAFRMLPRAVWSMPPLGTFNLHASLLPDYRGAAPIQWALIRGETLTGVTTFLLDEDIDTGDILLREEVPILDTDDAGTLHDRLMEKGADLILRTVEGLWSGALQPSPQHLTPGAALPTAPKIFREDCRLDWSWGVKRISDFVRGLSPYPGAWSTLHWETATMDVKLFRIRSVHEAHGLPLGRLFWRDSEMAVAASDGIVILEEIQLPGRKRLPVSEVLKGWKAPNNGRFT